MLETQVLSLGQEDPLEEETSTHSSVLAWKIPWTEEPGGLQFVESEKSWTGLSVRARTHACSLPWSLYLWLRMVVCLLPNSVAWGLWDFWFHHWVVVWFAGRSFILPLQNGDKSTDLKLVVNVKYWVGQKVCLGFSVKCYGKTRVNLLINPIKKCLTQVSNI